MVVLPATNDMCIIRKPRILNANAKLRTANGRYQKLWSCNDKSSTVDEKKVRFWNLPNVIKEAARFPGDSGISSSVNNAIKIGSNDTVTRVVSRNV